MLNNLLNVDAIPALLYILTVMNILLPIGSGLDKFGSIIKAEIGKCVEVMISSSSDFVPALHVMLCRPDCGSVKPYHFPAR